MAHQLNLKMKNRQHLSASEKQSHINQWIQSGLTRPQYCKQAEISLANFYNWTRREKEIAQSSSEVGFAEVKISDPVEFKGHIEIIYPEGVVVRLPLGLEASFIRGLVYDTAK